MVKRGVNLTVFKLKLFIPFGREACRDMRTIETFLSIFLFFLMQKGLALYAPVAGVKSVATVEMRGDTELGEMEL